MGARVWPEAVECLGYSNRSTSLDFFVSLRDQFPHKLVAMKKALYLISIDEPCISFLCPGVRKVRRRSRDLPTARP